MVYEHCAEGVVRYRVAFLCFAIKRDADHEKSIGQGSGYITVEQT